MTMWEQDTHVPNSSTYIFLKLTCCYWIRSLSVDCTGCKRTNQTKWMPFRLRTLICMLKFVNLNLVTCINISWWTIARHYDQHILANEETMGYYAQCWMVGRSFTLNAIYRVTTRMCTFAHILSFLQFLRKLLSAQLHRNVEIYCFSFIVAGFKSWIFLAESIIVFITTAQNDVSSPPFQGPLRKDNKG